MISGLICLVVLFCFVLKKFLPFDSVYKIRVLARNRPKHLV